MQVNYLQNSLVRLFILGLVATTSFTAVYAQEKTAADHTYKPLTLKLSDDGSKYLRVIIWNQMWARYTQNNPGTLSTLNGIKTPEDYSVDIGARRLRMLFLAQISPRFLILSHFGINNQTFATVSAANPRKPGLFLHDAWGEFAVIPEKLHIGTGLHYWNGVSRMTSASTLNFMTLDAPILNWATIDADDQFARQFGIYAKGLINRFDYRVALNKPFQASVGTPSYNAATGESTAATVPTSSLAGQAYMCYNFFDKESNKLPFYVGTYLGAKRILNVGGGIYYHGGAAGLLDKNGAFLQRDHRLAALDVFYEQPINKEKNTALSIYSAFYNYDFGPNFIRNVGIMNLHGATDIDPAKRTFAGAGNAAPLIGTGNIWYTQAGFLLPKMGDKGQFMPYVTYTRSSFDALKGGINHYNLGLNYFLNGHNAKITLQYGLRPVVNSTSLEHEGSKGELVIQTHVFL